MENSITWLGETNFRNERHKFGIKEDDRRRHIYIIGKTGVGKSTLIENMIIEDIRAGRGVAFLDPHGESAEKILDYIPEERVEDVIYLDPSDSKFPIAFNPLEQVDPEFRHLVASGMMGVLQKIWADAWSARMAYIMNNTLLALLEYPGTTLLGIMRMLNDAVYRKEVVDHLKDPVVKGFWTNEFARYSQKFETEATAAIQNKVGQFVSNPLVRNILGQAHSSIDLRKVMDEGKILIVNLSKGRIGEDNSALLGAMIITKLQLAAMSRVDIPEKDRRDFYLCVDEFQNFATESFATILSEARKYRLSLTVANQYLRQLDQEGKSTVKDAIFGNVGTMIIFRVGAEDGEFIEKEFTPEFLAGDMVSLAKYSIYIKLMIDGIASRPFSATTLPPPARPVRSYKAEIIEIARTKYALPREKVEGKIAEEWLAQSAERAAKVERRDERRLSSVLTEDAPVIKKRVPKAEGDFRKEFKNSYEPKKRRHEPASHTEHHEQKKESHIENQRHTEQPRERKALDLSALKDALKKAQESKKEGE
jgi:DNA segregation ATPase FtsK/SpoIIIE-like protein